MCRTRHRSSTDYTNLPSYDANEWANSRKYPELLRIITYGTERMDQPTLDALCELLPDIDFRQNFGMSELGIVRVKRGSSKQPLYEGWR